MKKSKNINLSKVLAAFILLAGCGVFAAGCAYCRVETSSPPPGYYSQIADVQAGEKVEALISAEITGWKLFGFIPLVSGNYNRPNSGTYKTFKDYVSDRYADYVIKLWGTEGLRGDRVVVLQRKEVSSGWWSLWILNYEAIRLEGEVLKK